MIRQEREPLALPCTKFRMGRSTPRGIQIDAARGNGRDQKAARALRRAARLRSLRYDERTGRRVKAAELIVQDLSWNGRAHKLRRNVHDLVGVRIGWKESELRATASVPEASGDRGNGCGESPGTPVRALGLQAESWRNSPRRFEKPNI